MSTTTVGIDETSYQRLLGLVEQTGRPAAVILDQALADYERKVSGQENAGKPRLAPVAAEEAELLEDAGRIRIPPREVRTVVARIIPTGRRAPRISEDEED
jgi:predicted transcriptional regulator